MDFALFAWFAWAALLAGIVKAATSAKHLLSWDWSVFKISDTNVVFQTAIILILVVRNNKKPSGIDGKTSDCLSRNCLYCIAVILSYVSASNCSLNL